ncbi:nuclear factor related to kappa-B-binding protein [Dioscorea alata]|uniref:Nuclear factor related to kappa-B-binding protein n=2 Tax=Dioscorea alata TaxID=55571 RepID=A0ACB7VTU3_DIOAL|nr:nuclear factor related to kappa-B-binding protein [Dioscorea alata]KAH7677955.1 nuclear factor related to kappa-B-binding protein [Dioscorea alata]
MAIVKNSIRVSKLDGDLSPGTASSDEDEDGLSPAAASDASLQSDGEDSGMGSDEYDVSELGEAGTELCQVGNQSCSIPLELYDLPGLGDVLSVETWNECLSEEDRFALSVYLPDMDQETFSLTLFELFSGANFHFGSPLADLFNKMKGGFCEPRVVLCRRGVNSFQRRKHYHRLREYHNSMVRGLAWIKDAWQDYTGYDIQERLNLLNILRSNGNLGGIGDVAGSETDLESEDSGERIWSKRAKVSKPSFDVVGLKQIKHGKENAKGILKVTAPKGSVKKGNKGADGRYPATVKHKVDKKSPLSALPWREQVAGYDVEGVQKRSGQMMLEDDDDEYDFNEQGYLYGSQGERNAVRGSSLKQGKRQLLRAYGRRSPVQFHDEDPDGYAGTPQFHDRNRKADQKVTIASYGHYSRDAKKKAKYSEREWDYPVKDQVAKGANVDWLDDAQVFRRSKTHGDDMASEKFHEWNVKGRKPKGGMDSKVVSHKAYQAQLDDSYGWSDQRGKSSQEKSKSKYAQNGSAIVEHSKSHPMYVQGEDTESDSSEHGEEDVDVSLMVKKAAYPIAKSVYDHKRASIVGKKNKMHSSFVDGVAGVHSPDVRPHTLKEKQKGRTSELKYLHELVLQNKGQGLLPYEKKQQAPVSKSYSGEKKRKGMADPDTALIQSNYMHNYASGIKHEDFDSHVEGKASINRKKFTNSHISEADHHEKVNMPLSACNSTSKKRKGKSEAVNQGELDDAIYLHASPKKQIDDFSHKKKGKKNVDSGAGPLTAGNSELIIPEKDIEPEPKIQKKPFTLITPTVHTGFSFSIVHLLSAVRKALINSQIEDSAVIGKLEKDEARLKQKKEEQNKGARDVVNGEHQTFAPDNMDLNTSESAGLKNLPSLTVQEIVSRVKSNPLDPCILETQEPLHDLVRGVLKIFSSKTAPLGAKGWKPLVSYEKSNKSWSWIGPVSLSLSDNDTVEEETSPEAWSIPHKMLVKLVDAFANWLKSGQETLQQIGSLPPPPIMPPCMDEKERFRDLRAQKSLSTISPSSDEVRSYFRREELLRYSVPDRAFSYTAADGKKSIVAPLRRGGGKPTAKARDHFMLKPDRPPHVTILCLVRDAAARLPGSIGTRADVCTLIRDSQYVVEDVNDVQVNQVVSGALDRLHYERDPCVQFDPDRKLWVYLHRDREEEDFEDDGTSSTKKWKRQRKDPSEQPELGTAGDVSYHAGGDPGGGVSSTGYDFNTDLNAGTSSIPADEKDELVYSDLRPSTDNIQTFIGSSSVSRNQNNGLNSDVLGMNALRENKILCQENFTSEDF